MNLCSLKYLKLPSVENYLFYYLLQSYKKLSKLKIKRNTINILAGKIDENCQSGAYYCHKETCEVRKNF